MEICLGTHYIWVRLIRDELASDFLRDYCVFAGFYQSIDQLIKTTSTNYSWDSKLAL